MIDIHIIDYNNIRVKTVFPSTPIGIKLRKAGLSPGPLGCQADLNYLYQQMKLSLGIQMEQMKLSLGIQMVESDKAK